MIKRIAVAAFAIAIGACSSEKVVGPSVPLNGIFVLRAVNGVSLPAQGGLQGAPALEIIADTIWIDADGYGNQKTVSTSAAATGPYVELKTVQMWDKGSNNFEVEYQCGDRPPTSSFSCIAPPHHKGMLTATGMTFTYSVLNRTPMVYQRVGSLLNLR